MQQFKKLLLVRVTSNCYTLLFEVTSPALEIGKLYIRKKDYMQAGLIKKKILVGTYEDKIKMDTIQATNILGLLFLHEKCSSCLQ